MKIQIPETEIERNKKHQPIPISLLSRPDIVGQVEGRAVKYDQKYKIVQKSNLTFACEPSMENSIKEPIQPFKQVSSIENLIAL